MADPSSRDEPPGLRASRSARAAGLLVAALVHLALLALLARRDDRTFEEPAALPPLQVSLHDAPRMQSTSTPLILAIVPDAPRTEVALPEFEVQPEMEPQATPDPAPAAPPASTRRHAPAPVCWPYRWLLGVSRSIESALRYPADARGMRGTAFVRISVERNGRIVDAPLLKSSGHPRLDAEARAVFLRIGRFEPVPTSDCVDYAVIVVDQPVRFGR